MNDLQIIFLTFSVFFLHLLLFLFRDNLENCYFFSLKLHVCVIVFIHEKEN